MSKTKGTIIDATFDKALGERYLSYALSTIMSRSLPDVRDGLKPVQRRILYAMYDSGNTYEKPFRKSASAVGFVMMKYHPHGNDPIYEAMVRLSQDFSTRYPLIEGQGNFGSLDGDNAAAMRYTEARLSKVGVKLLEGIEEEAVDFQATYNGESQEPLVLPTYFPNLLANGTTGIAVGMATNIPPHNVGEIIEALVNLIERPQMTVPQLLKIIPGPDFPTGGVIVEDESVLKDMYETGRGGLRLRARYEVENLKGGLYQIVVNEIPYQIQKARLIEKIATLLLDKKLPLLADVRDESTTEVRIILIPRNRNVDPKVLMESLFRTTDLETRFNLNMNVLDGGRVPKVMNLKEVLQAFLNHCQDVLIRRSRHRLARIEERLEILKGYQIAYLNLDAVIKVIRESEEPKIEMIKRWRLTDLQAESILNMRLRALRKLEEIKIVEEIKGLEGEKLDLEKLLKDERNQWQNVSSKLKEMQKLFGAKYPLGKRRTTFDRVPILDDVPIEAMVEKEAVTVVISEKGWVRVFKGVAPEASEIKYKEGDKESYILPAETTDKLIIVASDGRFYTIGVDKLPGARGHGEALRLMIDLPNEQDIVSIIVYKSDKPDLKLVLASSDSRGFMLNAKDTLAQTKNGKQVMTVAEGAFVQACLPVTGDHLVTVGINRKLLVFPLKELPIMVKGRGVILQKIKEGKLSDIKVFNAEQGLTWIKAGVTQKPSDWKLWLGKRGQAGRLVPSGFPRSNRFIQS